MLENLALRHQLIVLQRNAKKPRLNGRDRLFLDSFAARVGRLAEATFARPTSHSHSPASPGIPFVLEMEEPRAGKAEGGT